MNIIHKVRTQATWRTASFILLFNTAFLLYLLLQPGSRELLVTVDDCVVAAGPLLMSLLCFSYALKKPENPHSVNHRRVALLLGSGLMSYVIGQSIWAYYQNVLHQMTPFPSWGDAGYLGVYPFMLMGILLLSHRSLPAASRTRVLLDGVMIMVAVVTFSWYFVLGPTMLQGYGTTFAKIVGAAYPFSDLVMVFCVLLLSSHTPNASLRPAMVILSLALMIVVLTDSCYDYLTLHGIYATGGWMDAGWPLGFMLVGLAVQTAYLSTSQTGAVAEAELARNTASWQSFLPYMLVPAIAVLVIYTLHTGGNGPLELGVYVGAIILLVFVLLRQIFAIRETFVYARRTEQLNEELHIAHNELQEKNQALGEAITRLEALATTDPLTGLPNHRALVTTLDRELERVRRYGRCCSILFLDIDHFKALNDGYGHPAGDTVLHEFANVVQSTLRRIDTVGRWGGEEFVVIMPETDSEGALAAAERVRATVASHTFSIGGGVRLTCSAGLASYPQHAQERDSLVAIADQAMYAAKRLGRNQVRCANDPAVLVLETGTGKVNSREEAALVGTVEALTALVEARDQYTGQHTRRVGKLALQLALALGLDASEAHMIELAGRLHDIGKIGVPDAILQKPARLSEDEWALISRHPVVGSDVLSRVPSLRALAPLVRAHHEHWNGGGYPDKLAGDAIPLGARIIAVVDAYEAMTADRPYRHAYEPAKALAELQRCAGTQFDPTVVEAFERVLVTSATHSELVTVA